MSQWQTRRLANSIFMPTPSSCPTKRFNEAFLMLSSKPFHQEDALMHILIWSCVKNFRPLVFVGFPLGSSKELLLSKTFRTCSGACGHSNEKNASS